MASKLTNLNKVGGAVFGQDGSTPLPGVTVAVSGDVEASTTTGADGSWSFVPLADGSYSFTPLLSQYSFSPTSLSATISAEDRDDLNFSAVAYTPTPTPTPTATPTIDTTAPTVKAKNASGKAKKNINLRFIVSDTSGMTSERITIKTKAKKPKTIKRLSSPMSAIPTNGIKSVKWKPSASQRGKYQFCVISTDPSGNSNKASCASLKVN